jgi:hypothetical protein
LLLPLLLPSGTGGPRNSRRRCCRWPPLPVMLLLLSELSRGTADSCGNGCSASFSRPGKAMSAACRLLTDQPALQGFSPRPRVGK